MSVSISGNNCRTGKCCHPPIQGCLVKVPGECTYYSGSTIPGPSINPGDTLNILVTKIIGYISTYSSTFTFYKQMVVGSGLNNAPVDGATTYTDTNLVNKSIAVLLDGLELGTALSDRMSYTFNTATGTITWNSPLGSGQLIRLYTY